jgi:hypothetical protein
VKASDLLPAAERRRTGVPVKLALAVGQEAFLQAGRNAAEVATVFSSSGGDGENVHAICEVLASPEREVSPTRFHNSVHNASAGYWSIATGARAPSTSLCAFDASFTAGLLETVVQVTVGREPVALIAYDQPYPAPLADARPVIANFGVALVLALERTAHSLAAMDVRFSSTTEEVTRMVDEQLDVLRRGAPAARALPLLECWRRLCRGTWSSSTARMHACMSTWFHADRSCAHRRHDSSCRKHVSAAWCAALG